MPRNKYGLTGTGITAGKRKSKAKKPKKVAVKVNSRKSKKS